MTWSSVQSDCLPWFTSLPADSVDLVMGSPPYEAQRTYGIGFNLKGQAWVDWMVEVFKAATRVCKGLVCMVVEGFTKNYKLAEFFVASFCPPGGLVCDPFSGSGTTGAAAVGLGRNFIGCDIRESQVALTKRRLEGVTPGMFV